MAKLNTPRKPIYTHEGGKAKHINAEQQLKRTLMACMLWEKTFYESGTEVADRISQLVPLAEGVYTQSICIEAREKMKLRHAPLLVAREMARSPEHKWLVAETLERIIQRPDELTEFLAIYWKDGRQPLSAQVKKGLARAFTKFSPYQLAKYNRDGGVKLRDVLFLCHAKPKSKQQEETWQKLIDGTLEAPDTWEVALSSGADKKATWERLMAEKKLGGLALLRNLRNMQDVGVDMGLVVDALRDMNVERVLPFRFIAAAQHAPRLEAELESAMFRAIATLPDKLAGHTVLLVDVSGSMDNPVSSRSHMKRLDAACGVAMLLREICDQVSVYTFSLKLTEVAPRRGFALRDAIVGSQPHSGTYLGNAVQALYAAPSEKTRVVHSRGVFSLSARELFLAFPGQGLRPDRLIVITDEQSADAVPDPIGRGYMINVASYQNGVGYGAWLHIDGWSEAVVSYIQQMEKENLV